MKEGGTYERGRGGYVIVTLPIAKSMGKREHCKLPSGQCP